MKTHVQLRLPVGLPCALHLITVAATFTLLPAVGAPAVYIEENRSVAPASVVGVIPFATPFPY